MLVDDVADALDDSGLPAASLILEITESAMMHDTEATIAAARRAQGARRAARRRRLRHRLLVAQLPAALPDRHPQDRPLLRGSHRLRAGRVSLARAIVSLARSLHLHAVAEGVETRAQAEVLSELGCDLAQGFYLAVPQGAEAVEALLRDPGILPAMVPEALSPIG